MLAKHIIGGDGRWWGGGAMVVRTTLAAVGVLFIATAAAAASLGVAGDFNVFVLNNSYTVNSDVEGRMAVGGNATLLNFAVGAVLPNSAGLRDDLIVGGNLTFTNGQVYSGNIAYGGSATLSGLGTPNGTIRQDINALDFGAATAELVGLSDAYASLPAHGAYASSWGVTLTGSDPDLNVWNLTAAQLQAANGFGLRLDAPAGSTALINVSGSSVVLQNFQFTGFDGARTLFNYMTIGMTLNMSGVAPYGSVMAPTGEVNFRNGQFWGTLIAENLDESAGGGQFNYLPFTGMVPEPTAATLLMVSLGVTGLGRRRVTGSWAWATPMPR